MVIPFLFLIIVGLGAYMGDFPRSMIFGYLIASVVTFLVYAKDKAAARAGRRRTPERTLHLLAVVGGWPGAVLGQQWFRHKRIKRPFRRIFWCTVIINLIITGYLLRYSVTYVLAADKSGEK
jgi:uncharacterized membrane protein YsdA (DUF1294 family)